MVLKKNEILDFLQKNSGMRSGLLRYFTIIDEVDFAHTFRKLSSNTGDFFFFSKPAEKFQFLAYDYLTGNTNNDYGSFLKNKNLIISNTGEVDPKNYQDIYVPLYIGHQKFTDDKKDFLWNDFEPGRWFIPKVFFINHNESYLMVINFLPGDNDLTFLEIFETLGNNSCDDNNVIKALDDDRNEWAVNVNTSLDQIKKGSIQKVVLARRIKNEAINFSLPLSLNELKEKYPECFVFAYKKNNSVFFGASPEKLFSINGTSLRTEAVAGSYSRGKNQDEDILFEKELLNNPKELREHKNVVDYIRMNLKEFVTDEFFEEEQRIKKLKNIQHICTLINANVKEGINILDIVNKLHPTPAVCGLPKKEAFELIDVIEKFDRGLYAGILGWFNEHQVGEFIVGLRSALYTRNNLYAFAGCGIVEGSDPVSEFRETEMKLKPILSLLKNENTR